MLDFTTPNTKMWRLDELQTVIDDFENDVADVVNTRKLKKENNYLNMVLEIAGKSIVTFREVIALSTLGYADGAQSLSRNLFEQFVVLVFMENKINSDDFQNIVEDYHLNADILLLQNQINELSIYGGKDLRERKKSEEQELELKLKEAHHRTDIGANWWSGFSSIEKIINFLYSQYKDNVLMIGLIKRLNICYKLSCTLLHSNALGNSHRLCTEKDFVGIDTAPSEKGHGTPLWTATSSFIYVVIVACNRLNIKNKYKEKLSKLGGFYNGMLGKIE